MLDIAAIVLGVIAIAYGTNALRTKKVRTKRSTHYADGRVVGGRYLTGKSAVMVGIAFVVLGVALILLSILANLILIF